MEEKQFEKAILVGLNAKELPPDAAVTEETLNELEELLNTAGGVCVGRVIQNRQTPEPKTFLGTGKAKELGELAETLEANLIVFDNQLSPAQTRNLEELCGVRVIDRSTLILDIFAARAETKEGKLQVELAQYQYTLPRLTGKGLVLSRLGGGIGTRGPGETKLETERRHIRRHISRLEEELREVRRHREVNRKQRIKNQVPLVAIVGYTNAGKSTLLNHLTGAGISAQNRLFDTLDPTTRRYRVSDTLEVILSDTVGFIRKLPHHLVNAFRATLEELTFADLVLHVIDASDPNWREHAAVVANLMRDLDAAQKPTVTVFNKIDVAETEDLPRDEETVWISAWKGEGIEELNRAIVKKLETGLHRVRLHLPYASLGLLDLLHRDGKVLREEYLPDCLEIDVICDDRIYPKVREFRVKGAEEHE